MSRYKVGTTQVPTLSMDKMKRNGMGSVQIYHNRKKDGKKGGREGKKKKNTPENSVWEKRSGKSGFSMAVSSFR